MEDTEAPKITSQEKTKNPLRVEQGKRLAAISKAAKEKKARERFSAEQEMSKDILKESGDSPTFLLVLGVALVVSVGGYYVSKNKDKIAPYTTSSTPISEPVPEKLKVIVRRSGILIILDLSEKIKMKTPFNMIILGMTDCGKTYYLLEMLEKEFYRHFEYIYLICTTYKWNKTYQNWRYNSDPDFFVISCNQDDVVSELLPM